MQLPPPATSYFPLCPTQRPPAGLVPPCLLQEGSQAGVDRAVSTDPLNFTTWSPPQRVITAPAMAGKNFRDPLRAFQWEGEWYVGVGCNNESNSADLCLFQAADETLANFSFVGVMYSTNITHGQMNSACARGEGRFAVGFLLCLEFGWGGSGCFVCRCLRLVFGWVLRMA